MVAWYVLLLDGRCLICSLLVVVVACCVLFVVCCLLLPSVLLLRGCCSLFASVGAVGCSCVVVGV